MHVIRDIEERKKPILLTGLPRSGSTWVLRILGAAKCVIPFHEPDHLEEHGIGKKGMHLYVNKDQNDIQYYSLYDSIFKGRTYQPVSLTKACLFHYLKYIQSYLPNRVILVKSVFTLHNTDWIYKNFQPRVVILLRNPFSLLHSVRRLFPEARLGKPVLEDRVLIRDYLEGYEDILTSAKTPYEQLAARVGAYYKIILTGVKKHQEWLVITHEQLCKAPIVGFKQLYAKLGLCWTDEIEKIIWKHNRKKRDDNVHHVCRIATREIDKWKKLLTRDEINQIRKYYRPFRNEYYSHL